MKTMCTFFTVGRTARQAQQGILLALSWLCGLGCCTEQAP